MWDWSFVKQILPEFGHALLTTIWVTLLAALLALSLGLVLTLMRRSRNPGIGGCARLILEFVRGTPLLIQLFFVFFVAAEYGLVLSAFTAGTLVLGVHYATYTAEAYRGGIESIPKGQWEAATALGLSSLRTWRRIILPPAIRASIPALGTYIIGMYKDTALLFAIGVGVLSTAAHSEVSLSFRALEPYTLMGVLYLAISYPSSVLVRRLEARRG